jgi:hypothetical protein
MILPPRSPISMIDEALVAEIRRKAHAYDSHSDEGCYKVCGVAAEVVAARLLELGEERG